MEQTKFVELCMAYGKAQQSFQEYKNECHEFAVNFVNELRAYFKVPDSQFSLFKINAENEFKLVQPALISALTLRADSMWQFGIGSTVCSAPETLPQELILIQILIKKDLEGNYYLKYGEQEQERKIEKTDKWNFIPFLDYLHGKIINVYDNQLITFISQDTRRRIGFKS